MTTDEIIDGIDCLDGDLLDQYLDKKNANLRRMERRRMIRKRVLPAAACLVLVLALGLQVSFNLRYPFIPLENAVGDVSVRYVPEWMVEDNNGSFFPDYTDFTLFERTDYVFSGTVKKIQHIEIIFESKVLYHSIVTIQIDHLFEGDNLTEIRLFTPPIFNDKQNSDAVLNLIEEGSQGIFIAKKIKNDEYSSLYQSSIKLSELADAQILDEYSFAFLYEEVTNQFVCYDTIHDHANNLFDSLTAYDPNSVYEYIQKMTDME